MEEKLMKKDQIGKLYNKLKGEYNFFAPINKKGNIVFEKIENPEDIVLDYLNSKIPPKSILFPQEEVLFEYSLDQKDVEITDRQDLEQKNLIFVIRPCDAYSFVLMAK